MAERVIFFWNSDKKGVVGPGCMSQWASYSFVVDGEYYRCAEQYMMAEKARLFNDKEKLEKIMKAKSPMIMKRLGRVVSGFDKAKWAGVCFDVVTRGNFAKFSQNERLKEYLLSTSGAILAEASPKDSIWGIGIDAEEASRTPMEQWRGKNLLGKALMKVREMLRKGDGDSEEVERNKEVLAGFIERERSARNVRKIFNDAKKPILTRKTLPPATRVLSPGEEDALRRLNNSDAHSIEVFVETRCTLLQRVSEGDKDAFQEFYNIYCPAMLKYLGKKRVSWLDQEDIVQTVFANIYKSFVLPQDSIFGEALPRRNLLSVLVKTDKESGREHKIKFRQYLLTCMKNAVRTKWREDAKNAEIFVSLDSKIDETGDRTWKEYLEDYGVDSRSFSCTDAEGERLAAVWGIWQSVIKGILLDESLSDCSRDVMVESLMNDISARTLADKWGITENNVYRLKNRGKEMAENATRAIYKALADGDVDIGKEVGRLYNMVASMKPGRHVDRLMIKLAEKLAEARK